jgi:AcrR family transcriptional regulator
VDEIVIKPDTKQLLLDAAQHELGLSGIEGFRIEAILGATGASFSSLYHHYKNRDGLITAALVSSFQAQVDLDVEAFLQAAKQASSSDDIVKLIRAGLDNALTTIGMTTRNRQLAVFAASLNRPELLTAIAAAQRDTAIRIASVFSDLKSQGIVPATADIEGFAWFSQQIVLGLKVTDLNTDDFSPARAAETALRAARGILAI